MSIYDKTPLRQYLQEISSIPVLSRAEETTLIPAAQAGDREAFDKVIRCNLRYVVSLVNEYKDRGITIMDLISEGNLGLIKALESFDCARGTRFITYAKWWIRHYVVYALLYKSHLVRIPQSQIRNLRKLKKEKQDREQHGAGWQGNAYDYETFHDGPEQAPSLVDCLVQQHSLDQPYGEGKDSRMIDFVPDPNSVAPDHGFQEDSLKTDLKQAFSILKEREVDVLTMLFGFHGGRVTLRDVASKYGISSERVRQIKNNALDKLRASTRVRVILVDYLA